MVDIVETVKDVLNSSSARRIDFYLGLMHVDAAGLFAIRGLIATGIVRVKVVASAKANVAAAYNYAANTLTFPRANYGATVQEKSDILHECIHALHARRLALYDGERERGHGVPRGCPVLLV